MFFLVQAKKILPKTHEYAFGSKKKNDKVIATGFEPVTASLEVRCSIQLSYATLYELDFRKSDLEAKSYFFKKMSYICATKIRFFWFITIKNKKNIRLLITTLLKGY